MPLSAPASPTGGGNRQGSELSEVARPTPSSEADELYGDYIDEETQQARMAGGAGLPSGCGEAVTNSSWRMARWMGSYCSLMRTLPAAAPSIFAGLAELYELYLLHVFIAFSDVSIGELLVQHHQQQQGGSVPGGAAARQRMGSDSLSPRLQGTLLRIATDSIGKYRPIFSSSSSSNGMEGGSKLVRALTPAAANSSSAGAGTSSAMAAQMGAHSAAALAAVKDRLRDQGQQYFARRSAQPAAGVSGAAAVQPVLPSQAATAAAAASAAAAAAATPVVEISAVSNAGNLYGLLERSVAAESLLAVAGRLAAARQELAPLLPAGEAQQALDAFYARTVGAAEDLRDHVLRAGARLLLPVSWVADRVGMGNYVLAEPPSWHSPWVNELEAHLQLFKDRLAQVVEGCWHGRRRRAPCCSCRPAPLDGTLLMLLGPHRVVPYLPLPLRVYPCYLLVHPWCPSCRWPACPQARWSACGPMHRPMWRSACWRA